MKKIRLIAQNRSGSTFLLNVFNIIFGKENVEAGHKIFGGINPPNVIVFRDTRDSFVSIARAHSKITTNEELKLPVDFSAINTKEGIDKMLNFYHINYMLESSLQCVDILKKSNNILILKYELFFNNYDYLFNMIESYFKIKISESKKNEVIKKTNITKMKEIQNTISDFATFDHETMIHGDHIHKGQIGGWREVIPKELHGYITDKLKNQLIGLGYET